MEISISHILTSIMFTSCYNVKNGLFNHSLWRVLASMFGYMGIYGYE